MSALNGTLIRDRRIANRISQSLAADLLGVGVIVLQRIEANDDAATRQVPLVGLLHLATALGCQPADLFTISNTNDSDTEDGQDPTATHPEAAQTPAAILSGFLLAKRAQVSIKDIATALNWTRKEVHTAKAALSPLLHGTGIRLAERADMLHLVPTHAATVNTALQANTKNLIDRRGINDGVAKVLRQAVDGTLSNNGHHSVFNRNAVATLTTLGAIDPEPGSLAPSSALLYALGRTSN